MCFFIIQDWEHIGYQKNTVKSSGKGPNLLAQKLKMNKTEKNYIKQCVRSLEEGNITDNEDGQVAEYFVPNKKAKHRVPKHYNLNNPTQKKKETKSKNQVGEKKVKERKEMKRKCEPSTSSEEEDTDIKQSDSVPPQKEKKKLQTNPLLITFINDQIKKCSGCEIYFGPGDRR